jgi:two-component sensor histidine kinase
VHKRLYQGEELGYVEVDAYLKSLLSEIDSAFVTEGQKVSTALHGNGISLDIDTIIPFGLILTELVTNSFKYAGTNPLEISVSLVDLGEDKYRLEYQDNGPGIPETFNIIKARSLGMRMIRRLTQQLNGSFQFENKNGLRVEIYFEGTAQRQKTA